MNVVPFDVLVKLMSDFYTDEVVEASKQVLFETAFSNRNAEPPHQYSHKRRGQDKKSKNIPDIISVFLELPPHVTPSYVAKDLSNLPPLNMKKQLPTAMLQSSRKMRVMTSRVSYKDICFHSLCNFVA